MSFHHFDRLRAHFDLATLNSPCERAVLTEIAIRINSKSRSVMRFTNAFLAEHTGFTENNVQKATAALIAKGLISAHRNRATSASAIYDLLIHCPADCKTKAHYCAWERVILNEKGALDSALDNTMSSVPEPRSGVSNRDNRENRENKETNTVVVHSQMNHLAQVFTFEDFEAVVSDFYSDSLEHKALEPNIETAYKVFLKMLATSPTKISDPLAYVAVIARDNPLRLLAGAPGSTPRQKPQAKLPFIEAITLICSELGIDYETEFEGSHRKRYLYELHSKGKLTASAVIASYNSVREPSEKLLASTPSNAY